MDEEEKRPTPTGQQPPSTHQELLSELSAVVFDALRAAPSGAAVVRRELLLPASAVQRQSNEDDLRVFLSSAVCRVYWGSPFREEDVDVATTAAIDKLKDIWSLQQARDTFNRDQLEHKARAFQAPYVGDADVEFRSYLARCCSAYRHWKGDYKAPYVVITQSSGFGKSRILERLSDTTAEGNLLVHDDDQFTATILYVCARNVEGSTGYPRATSDLMNWLFPEEDCSEDSIAGALQRSFKCAVESANTGTRWKGLFDNKEINGTMFDAAVVDDLKSVMLDTSMDQPQAKKQRSSEEKMTPVLVVAIDEARALFQIKNSGVSAFRSLRRALTKANKSDTVTKYNGMIFAVLSDTFSQVHKFVPALGQDSSSQVSGPGSGDTKALFPPFIVTQTMDVRLTSTTSCRSRVLVEDPNELWETLASMGRPLWYSFRIGATVSTQQNHLNKLAASKLLIGLDPKEGSSYNDSTLHGVASLFCRVGLRPLASDPVAARLVADFMSVMHYVTYKNDAHITSYSSDPILTFGASYLWYQLSPPALESQILPQFQAMLANGVVDTGNIGEIVARIFLLLAMDATIMGNEVLRDESARKAFVFSGQFCDVTSFVNMLLGENPAVRVNETPPNRPEADIVKDWLANWEGWRMGFSHFAEMSKMPAQDILWKMLDRRAAGIMPRNQDGADLVIPIFRKAGDDHQHKSPAATSFILIQVKNLKDKDQGFPTTALANLNPRSASVTDIHYTSNRAS